MLGVEVEEAEALRPSTGRSSKALANLPPTTGINIESGAKDAGAANARHEKVAAVKTAYSRKEVILKIDRTINSQKVYVIERGRS